MFALPPLLTLLFFVYIRPQEYYTQITIIPWLHLLFGLSLVGHIIDIKLSIIRLRPTPHLPWMVAYFVWAIISTGINAGSTLFTAIFEIFLFLLIGYLIGNSFSTLRALNSIAVVITILATLLAGATIYQSRQPTQCVKADLSAGAEHAGVPDGRPCERIRDCTPLEPGARYYCEHVGVMGTMSVYGRARYRGIFKDPNDLSLTLSIALPLLVVLMRLKPTFTRIFLVIASTIHTAFAILPTKSRGGQLVFLAIWGMHFLFYFGLKTSMIAGAPGLPLLLVLILLRNRRADADASSEERIRCQWNSLRMFSMRPITGVGYHQTTQYWKQAAHNAYIQAPAELGIVGLFLWYGLSYMTFKTLILVRSHTKEKPQARAAFLWSEALLASNTALHLGISFLSFCYHPIYWIYLGLAGALYKAVKRHDPDFEVRFTGRDLAQHLVISGGWFGLWKAFVEYKYSRL